MRILHSKTTSEPVLMVSACHSMNLLAVVTASSAVVYRATTLTALMTHALQPERSLFSSAAPGGADGAMQASWSPSGRIFALALSTGVILLLDVEDGVLVRRLVPRALLAATASQRHPDSVLSGEAEEEEAEGVTSDGAAGKGEEAEEEEEARRVSCEAALAAPPSVPISIPSAPVLGMTWTTVSVDAALGPSSQRPASGEETRQQCLPVRPTISLPLLDEVETSSKPQQQQQQQQRGGGGGGGESSLVAFLTILASAGSVSIVAGGLQEVYCTGVQHMEGVGAEPSAVQQFLVAPSHGSAEEESAPFDPSALSFNALTAQSLLLSAARMAKTRGRGTNHDGLHPTQSRRPHRRGHCGYLVTGGAANGKHPSQQLWRVDFGDVFVRLSSQRVPVLCRIEEHCRTAWCCLRNVHAKWKQLLHTRTRPHLRLPECARLLRDAVVEAVTPLDEGELEDYYRSVDRDTLAEDLGRISVVLSVLANDLYTICYRSYDLAFALAVELSSGGCRASDSAARPAVYERLCELLARHREYCESLLLRMQVEAGEEANLVLFVLQRASLLFGLADDDASAAERDAMGIPLNYGAEPLPSARHPALLATVERILHGKASPTATASERQLQEWHSEMEPLFREGLTLGFHGGEAPRGPLSRRAIPLPEDEDFSGFGFHFDLECPPHGTACRTTGEEERDGGPSRDEPAVEMLVHTVKVPVTSPSDGAKIASLPVTVRTTADAEQPFFQLVASAGSFAPVSTDVDPSLLALAAVLPPSPTIAWYSRVEDDKHILLYLSGGSASKPPHRFTLVAVDNEGHVKAQEADEDNEEEEEEEKDEGAGRAASCTAGFTVLEVSGMEVRADSLLTSMSKGRQFCVVAAGRRFVVIDVFEG